MKLQYSGNLTPDAWRSAVHAVCAIEQLCDLFDDALGIEDENSKAIRAAAEKLHAELYEGTQ